MSTPERSMDVTAWLRAEAEGFADMHGVPPANVAWHKESADRFCEATDTIDALQQDVRRLEAERDKAIQAQNQNAYGAVVLHEQRNALLADRDAQVREAEERAFMAGFFAMHVGEWSFGTRKTSLDPGAAFAAYKASAAGARTDAKEPAK